MSGNITNRYKNGSGGINNGKQRTWKGAYSNDADRNTGSDLADYSFKSFTGTRDEVRMGADHPDLGTYPAFGRANYYVSGDGFKMGKQIYNVGNIDPDGSRALQKDWHARAGFSGVVSPTENEQGGTHPKAGHTKFASRGTDAPSSGQGSPGGFKWR
jgi:hypothetical protein